MSFYTIGRHAHERTMKNKRKWKKRKRQDNKGADQCTHSSTHTRTHTHARIIGDALIKSGKLRRRRQQRCLTTKGLKLMQLLITWEQMNQFWWKERENHNLVWFSLALLTNLITMKRSLKTLWWVILSVKIHYPAMYMAFALFSPLYLSNPSVFIDSTRWIT